uniref:Uncharacterized protein n=1 Tax=Lepeophtheirus salmonis TaxID=72036 RepID=A0A0K2ULH6_LEPSM
MREFSLLCLILSTPSIAPVSVGILLLLSIWELL